MRFIIKICVVLVLGILIYGIHGMYVWFSEREQNRMSCLAFMMAADPPNWVALTDCQVDWGEAVRGRDGEYFVPVRPGGTRGRTKLVMEVRSPEHLRRVEAAQAAEMPDVYTGELAGLAGGEMWMGRRSRRAIRNSLDVTNPFTVLQQGARPEIVWPAIATLGGLGIIIGSWKVARWARRPDPAAPPHVGPLPPPEQIIARTREIAGPPPRNIKRLGGLIWPMPQWLEADTKDALRTIYHDQEKLLSRGRIVWGFVVQANALLFEKGPDDSRAAILHSTDEYFDANPDELAELAEELFSIKGEETDPELMNFSRILADETTRAMRLEVPRRFTGGREVIYTSIMVRRIDLPDGVLADGMFPLLVLPGETTSALIVPWEWWSPAMVAMWRMPRSLPPPPLPPQGPRRWRCALWRRRRCRRGSSTRSCHKWQPGEVACQRGRKRAANRIRSPIVSVDQLTSCARWCARHSRC